MPRSFQLVPRPSRPGRPENQREGSEMASSTFRAPSQGASGAIVNRVRRSRDRHEEFGGNRKRARRH